MQTRATSATDYQQSTKDSSWSEEKANRGELQSKVWAKTDKNASNWTTLLFHNHPLILGQHPQVSVLQPIMILDDNSMQHGYRWASHKTNILSTLVTEKCCKSVHLSTWSKERRPQPQQRQITLILPNDWQFTHNPGHLIHILYSSLLILSIEKSVSRINSNKKTKHSRRGNSSSTPNEVSESPGYHKMVWLELVCTHLRLNW